ncbi:lysozyme inhibitor LprI family protein [Vreelandella profundi]|uniref:lysozyme inhibitor LprI family protein n=1 Tax=Vreelandella profundi TaxID=2852117 RepID=UPI001EEFB7C2|nr:lysozyme inhibitor LprI family protein [Halomonas profundi]
MMLVKPPRLRLYLFIIVAWALCTSTSYAQDEQSYRQNIEECLASTDTFGEKIDCIGQPAHECMANRSDGDTAEAMTECYEGVLQSWDARLSEAYSAMQAEQSTELLRTQLLDAHRTWLSFRDGMCKFISVQDPTIANLSEMQCVTQLTGEQALRLESMLE